MDFWIWIKVYPSGEVSLFQGDPAQRQAYPKDEFCAPSDGDRVMNRSIGVIVLLSLLYLAGCSSGVTRPAETGPADAAPVVLSSANPVGELTLSLSGKASEQLGENLKFNQDTLLDHVKRAMQAKGLLKETAETPLPIMEIVVTDIRVRSNFNAVMWGFMAGADHIKGDVVLRSASGEQMDRFGVSASYALGGLAGGQDDARMGWLYEKFAEETVTALSARK